MTKPAPTSAVHPPPGAAASFATGVNSLVAPPLKATAASSPAAIHSARFIIHSLIKMCLYVR